VTFKTQRLQARTERTPVDYTDSAWPESAGSAAAAAARKPKGADAARVARPVFLDIVTDVPDCTVAARIDGRLRVVLPTGRGRAPMAIRHKMGKSPQSHCPLPTIIWESLEKAVLKLPQSPLCRTMERPTDGNMPRGMLSSIWAERPRGPQARQRPRRKH
jgi:hypothetical protein